MLVIRRREGEEIIINETTRIRVLKVAPGCCQIGIEAPLSDKIRRGELISHSSILYKIIMSPESSDSIP